MTSFRTLVVSASGLAIATAALPTLALAQATGPDHATPPTSVADPGRSAAPNGPGGSAGTADAADAIVVTGVRASLQTAQKIKQNATQVVDSIASEDIGKLPDNTVSDALQRVTGIQVQRNQGEVSAVQIRGLPDAETFINGREIFTGTGRGVALQDIPAELVAGVDVYKTSTPDQIEGSVSGLIDIRLRRPFDFNGLQVAGSARAIYGEQIGKVSYIASGLVSDRWESKGGQQFGILIGASYNKRKYEDQTAFNFGFNRFTNPATGNTALQIPDTVGGLVTDGDRSRPSGNISLQWKPNSDLEFHADAIYTGYRQDYDVDFFVGLPKAGNVSATTAVANSATADANPLLAPGVAPAPIASTITTLNNFTISSRQTFHQKTDGYQGNIGGKWTTGKATLSTEVTYNDSEVTSTQLVLDTAYVVPRIDYNFNIGGTPHLNFNGFNYKDPTILNLLTLFDNHNTASSEQIAWRGDLIYDNSNTSLLRNFKVGARVAHRTGNSAGTNGSGFPLGFLPQANFTGVGSNAPNNIVDGKLGVDGFALANTGFLRSNIVQLRGLAGLPAGGRADDPALVFGLREDVYAAYGQIGFGFDAGSMPVEGVVGVRLVNTVTRLDAIENVPLTGLTPTVGRRNDLNVLPSITVKIRPTQNTVFRVAAGQAIFRPQFAQLNPATSLTQLGVTGGAIGSGAGGNANLSPVKSDDVDVSAEWYFSNTGSVTVGAFYKHLNGYIQTYGTTEIFPNSLGVPAPFQVFRPRNTGSGELKGIEAGYQQFFDFLPGPLSGFGVQANFTLSDGHVQAPPVVGQPVTQQDITLTSKYSYNVVAIYEKYGFSARLAYNWRDKYTDSYSDNVPGRRIIAQPLKFLDFSASYEIAHAITLTADATNLLKERYHDNFGTTGLAPRDTRAYDRTFGAGVRFRF